MGLVYASFFFFSRPTDAFLSPEPGGGQGNLATHTAAQGCVYFIFVFIRSLCYAFSARHPPLPRGTVGSATSPFRVGVRLSSSRPPHHHGGPREGFRRWFLLP